MCLIIQRKANFELPYDKFKSAILNNPDGYGLCFPDKDKLKVYRSAEVADPEKLYRVVNEELIDKPVLLHFRFTTAGDTNLRNSHPFPILEHSTDGIDLRMAHNGTITSYKGSYKSNESDTRNFVKFFVRPLFKRLIKGASAEELLLDPFVNKLLTDAIPKASVLSFIDGAGRVLNINPTGNGGKEEDEWFYSNTYSFNPKHREPTGNSWHQDYGFYDPKPKALPPPKADKKKAEVIPFLQRTFDKSFGIESYDEYFSLSDDTIGALVKDQPIYGIMLVKDLIKELYLLDEQNYELKMELKK